MAEREILDVDLRGVRRGALAIAGGILFAGLAAWFLLRELGPAENTPPRAAPLARPESAFSPAPRLQPAPQQERAAYFAEKARKTGSYGWVDREAGLAHIPLEEAMRLLAARAAVGGQASGPPGGPPGGAAGGRPSGPAGGAAGEPASGPASATGPGAAPAVPPSFDKEKP